MPSNSAFTSPVYLAGLPRSGTTWFGWAFAAAANTTLTDEPFNCEFHPEAAPYNMTYLPASNRDRRFVGILKRAAKADLLTRIAANLPYRLQARLPSLRSKNARVVIKDVHTLLSLEKVWETIRPFIVVIIRHPGAVANSWHRLLQKGDFVPQNDRLLGQPALIDAFLSDFASHMQPRADFFFNVGSYWGAVYYVVDKLLDSHRDDGWQCVTHEYLCDDPLKRYVPLFDSVGLTMTVRARTFLMEKDSKHESEKWKSALTPEQFHSVLEGAEPYGLLDKYYPQQQPTLV